MRLSQDTEEVATFYGRMLDHDYTTKEVFNKNFFKDWRKIMNDKEKDVIRLVFLSWFYYPSLLYLKLNKYTLGHNANFTVPPSCILNFIINFGSQC